MSQSSQSNESNQSGQLSDQNLYRALALTLFFVPAGALLAHAAFPAAPALNQLTTGALAGGVAQWTLVALVGVWRMLTATAQPAAEVTADDEGQETLRFPRQSDTRETLAA